MHLGWTNKQIELSACLSDAKDGLDVAYDLILCLAHLGLPVASVQHCSGINCVTGPGSLKGENGGDYLFSGSRDGTLKRWELGADEAVCGATFESHVDWVWLLYYDETLHSCTF